MQSTKPFFLFFILLSLSCLDPAAESAKYTKAVPSILAPLLNMQISTQDALKSVYNSFVSVVPMKDQEAMEILEQNEEEANGKVFSKLFSLNTVVMNEDNQPNYVTPEMAEMTLQMKVDENLMDFETLKNQEFPDSQNLTEEEKNKLAAKYVENMDAIISAGTQVIQSELLTQLFEQMRENSNDIKLILHADLFTKLEDIFWKKLEVLQEKIQISLLDQDKIFKQKIVAAHEAFEKGYFRQIQKIPKLLNKPAFNLRVVAIVLLNNAALLGEEATVEQLVNYSERIHVTLEGMASIAGESEEVAQFDLMEKYLASFKQQNKARAEMDKKEFQALLMGITQDLLKGLVTLGENKKCMHYLREIFTGNSIVTYSSDKIVSLIEHIYEEDGLAVEFSNKKNEDIAQKMNLMNMLLYLKDDHFSDEQLNKIIDVLPVIASVPSVHYKTVFSAMRLFELPYLNFDRNTNLNHKLMNLILDFGANEEEELDEMSWVDQMDDFLNFMHEQSNDSELNKFYLVIKMLVLALTSSESEHVTKFDSCDELCLNTMLVYIEKEPIFKTVFGNVAVKLKNSSVTALGGYQKIIEELLGQEYNSNLFSMIRQNTQVTESKIGLGYKPKKQKIRVEKSINSVVSQVQRKVFDKIAQNFQHNKNTLDLPANKIILQEDKIEEIPVEKTSKKEVVDTGIQTDAFNFVNVVSGVLPEEAVELLQEETIEDFAEVQDVKLIKGDVETTYVFVKVVRKDSPCYEKVLA